MKNFKLVIVAIFVLMFIASCNKDENDSRATLERKTISAKWMISNSNEYKSFEFNESGNYIVVENATTKSANDQIILFGTYEITNNKSIVLSDFGTLTITGINENEISFSVRLTSDLGNDFIFNALKHEEMHSSSRTDLLCRTWEMVTENGEPVEGTEMELTVLISKAGTYFVSFANPEDENDGGLAQWKWNDEAETQMLYSWDEVPVWDDEYYAEILELTSDSLKLTEYDDVWVLKPASNTKSAKINTSNLFSGKAMNKGFFKNKSKKYQ